MQIGRGGRSAAVFAGFALLRFIWLGLVFLAMPLAAAHAAAPGAKSAGEVVFVEGVATAQASGATPRFLQKGEALFEGETVSTGAQGFTIIAFTDGTKFTLRPNTSFEIQRFSHGGAADSATFRLLKGGMRAVTGLISKNNPKAMEVNAVTATIGIRGTSFDAVICSGTSCAEEVARSGRKPPAAVQPLVVARIALLSGSAQAIGPGGQARALAEGSGLFTGDTVRTDKGSHALVAFRDQTKVTVIADSEFKLEDVSFSGPRSEGGNFAVRIVRGGMRAVTGLLAKSNPKAVKFNAMTATIGIRGSALDGHIGTVCAVGGQCGQGVAASVRTDGAFIDLDGKVLELGPGQSGITIPGAGVLALTPKPTPLPDPNAPLPEDVPVDFDALFASVERDRPDPGLHVGMRNDGEVFVFTNRNRVDLAGEEAALVREGDDIVRRVSPNWASELNANLPDPGTFDPSTRRVQFNTGGVICEIR